MSMSAIERVIPLVGHLPPSIREGWRGACASSPGSD